ncbi:MAG TPA: hydrogenase maturation protease [Gammaproteobacteria bacterium]
MPCRATERTCVALIGVGSPFGADRLGWLAIDALESSALARRFPHLQLKFIRSDRPGALLIEQLRTVDGAVIIDAMRSGVASGAIQTFLPEELARESALLSSHGFGVAEALALAAILGELPDQLLVVGIEMGEEVSEGSLPERVIEPLRKRIEALLSSIRGDGAAQRGR